MTPSSRLRLPTSGWHGTNINQRNCRWPNFLEGTKRIRLCNLCSTAVCVATAAFQLWTHYWIKKNWFSVWQWQMRFILLLNLEAHSGTNSNHWRETYMLSYPHVVKRIYSWPAHAHQALDKHSKTSSVFKLTKLTGQWMMRWVIVLFAPMNIIKHLVDATMKGRTASNSKKIIIYSNMRDKIIKIGQK